MRGSVVKNTDWVLGLVIYTGHETKIVKNSTRSLLKFSKLETLLSKLILGLIFIMLSVSLLFTWMGRHWTLMMLGKSDYLKIYIDPTAAKTEQQALDFIRDVI